MTGSERSLQRFRSIHVRSWPIEVWSLDGCFVNNKLRLPAGTFERHHRVSRDFCGHLGAEIASHEVKTQIEACGGAGGRQHMAVVDIQHVGIDVDGRITARQLRCAAPVSRSPQAIKRPGSGQNKRAGTNRRDPRSPIDRSANRAEQGFGN